MPKVSPYARKRIQSLHENGLQPLAIFKKLRDEGSSVSYQSVARIVIKIKLTGSVDNLPKSGRPRKLNASAKAFIEAQMRKNDEATSRQIQKKLFKRGVEVHPSTVRRARKEKGWTLQNTKYCQLIRDINKTKRLEFAQRVIATEDTFDNIIFSDECSISLQQFRRTCYRKVGEPPKRKPKPKHPLKVHVWAGISRHSATKICVFEGIMEAKEAKLDRLLSLVSTQPFRASQCSTTTTPELPYTPPVHFRQEPAADLHRTPCMTEPDRVLDELIRQTDFDSTGMKVFMAYVH